MIVEIVDVLRGLLPLGPGVEADTAVAEPFRVDPNRLYVWPRRSAPQQLNVDASEEGFFDDADLRIRILYTLPSKGEPRAKAASRELTVALDAATKAIIAALWQNSVYPPGSGWIWHHLIIETVLPDVVRTVNARGWAIDVVLKLSAGAGTIAASGGGSGGS